MVIKLTPYNNNHNNEAKNKIKEESRAFIHVRLSFSEFHFVHTLS